MEILSSLTRSICLFLIPKGLLYYPGMMVVRLMRWLRSIRKIESNIEEFHVVTVYPRAKMKVDKNAYMGGSLFRTGFHHINEILFLNSFLRPDMVFLDVGANQGEFSIFAASKIKSGRVLAFEPGSASLTLLKTNKELNHFDHLEIYPYGLSHENAVLPIYTTAQDDTPIGRNEGLSSVYQTDFRSAFVEEIEVKVFDEIFYDKLGRIDFLKIDIEGGELYALQGMKKSIQKFRPWVLIEVGEETISAAGYSTSDLVGFFQELGYSFFEIKRGILQKEPVIQFNKWGNYIVNPN